MARRVRRPSRALAVGLLTLVALACGPAAKPAPESEKPQGDAKERLAAKRKELEKGGAAPAKTSLKESLAQRRAGSRVQDTRIWLPRQRERTIESEAEADELEPAGAEVLAEEPPTKPSFPAHLSRRESLTLACYRDDFNVREEAHMEFLLPQEREFCRCMVDAIYSARVPASLQDVLIEDFMKNRGQVEDAVPQFKQRWRSRCPM